jgi:predicted transposase YdaD
VSKASDIGGKRLIGLAPDDWARWVTQRPDVVAEEIVVSDFQWVSRENDVLIRAASPTEGRFLLLNELQLRYDPRMPRRMQAYAALAEARYDLPVYPVVVTILPPPAGTAIPDRHDLTFMGLQARRDYRVLNLWEIDAELVLRQPVRPLLPFVPVLKGGGDERVIRQALAALRADEQLSDIEPLLAYFARFVLDSQLVLQIMRWDMAVLEQSPWYQEIIERGIERGRLEELRRQVRHALERRFGAAPPEVVATLEGLGIEQLEPLVDAAWTDDSLAAFQARLPVSR